MGRLDRNPKTDVRQRRALQRLVANNGTTSNAIAGEVPTGTIDGVNADFELNYSPVPASLKVYRNGLKLREGAANDYTLSGSTITFTAGALPLVGSVIEVDYTAA
jgi:hypothetical protein